MVRFLFALIILCFFNCKGREFSFKQLSNHILGVNRLPSNLQETVTDQNNPYKNYDNLALDD